MLCIDGRTTPLAARKKRIEARQPSAGRLKSPTPSCLRSSCHIMTLQGTALRTARCPRIRTTTGVSISSCHLACCGSVNGRLFATAFLSRIAFVENLLTTTTGSAMYPWVLSSLAELTASRRCRCCVLAIFGRGKLTACICRSVSFTGFRRAMQD